MNDITVAPLDGELVPPTGGNRVERIKWCERNGEALQWEAARLIAGELADGKTQRQLAGEIGKSLPHVNYMAQVWKINGVHLGEQERSFNECYQAVKAPKVAPGLEASQTPPVSTESAATPVLGVLGRPESPDGSVDDSEPIDAEIVSEQTALPPADPFSQPAMAIGGCHDKIQDLLAEIADIAVNANQSVRAEVIKDALSNIELIEQCVSRKKGFLYNEYEEAAKPQGSAVGAYS